MSEIIKDGIEYYSYEKDGFHINTDAEIGVLCPCGNTEFTLRYGAPGVIYCLRAKCTKCGRIDTVYDG